MMRRSPISAKLAIAAVEHLDQSVSDHDYEIATGNMERHRAVAGSVDETDGDLRFTHPPCTTTRPIDVDQRRVSGQDVVQTIALAPGDHSRGDKHVRLLEWSQHVIDVRQHRCRIVA